jgi:hypothetical protein
MPRSASDPDSASLAARRIIASNGWYSAKARSGSMAAGGSGEARMAPCAPG